MNRINRIGRFLSYLVFQNIAGLIGLGLLRVLFGERGWFPIPAVQDILTPILKYFLPLLFAYTGGRMIGSHRGGVIASFVMIGMIAGNPSDYSMLMPAMLVGPLTGWIIARTDRWLTDRIPVGLELLCYNVAAGFIGVVLCLFCYAEVAYWFVLGMEGIHGAAKLVLESNYLPWVALAVEPGKVMFLNNVINHGILEPLGIQQTKEFGQSVFFLLETNPGPGAGLLLAYYLRLKNKPRDNARSSLLIQFVGGIHEVYFPYALMRPLVIVPLIAGGLAGNWVFVLLEGGLVATPSPGSLIALMLMAPKGMHLPVLGGVLASAAVSFAGSYLVLAWKGGPASDDPAAMAVHSISEKSEKSEEEVPLNEEPQRKTIRKIYFACDAGMGSSAMGAALLRKKIKQAGLPVEVGNCSVDDIPADADLVISQARLTARAQEAAPRPEHLSIVSFVDAAFYDGLIGRLRSEGPQGAANEPESGEGEALFTPDHVQIGAQADDKWQAIRQVGGLLVRLGLVRDDYIDRMIERERVLSTFIGNGVALPHGVGAADTGILKPGIVIAQYPDGVTFDEGNKAYLLIAVVGGEQQMGLVSRIAFMIEKPETVQALVRAESPLEMHRRVSAFLQEPASETNE
ncbi:PTS sugar transporter subunit IIA [Paenibacillus ehimensis]|uniref:Mannitol-specific phosphotransferase enzyme IIA component n=1 Tax=Paenibacillus ehimensis TaxID=79264 RepID=A0ABT8VA01_9BACL|nr:PTS sugar transporter subunit IIA [Paenibacillus ehimensis]MDO3677809.1 PTS sugar transporter subunit IIA [Paenibacillus ehimensis]